MARQATANQGDLFDTDMKPLGGPGAAGTARMRPQPAGPAAPAATVPPRSVPREARQTSAAAPATPSSPTVPLSMLKILAFQPLEEGVRTTRDALYVLGLSEHTPLDSATVGRRFRELAPVFHEDTGPLACSERMTQLVEARNLLQRQTGRIWPFSRG